MARVARQESSVDAGTSSVLPHATFDPTSLPLSPTLILGPSTNIENTGTPTDAANTDDIGPSADVATDPTAATNTNDDTAAATTVEATTAPPTSPGADPTTTSDGAGDTGSSPTVTESSQSTQADASSATVLSESNTDSQSSSITDATSASVTDSASTTSTITSSTSTSSASTSSLPSSTTESASTSESSSTPESSSTDSSSSHTNTGTHKPSLTTSFTEIVQTVNGQVTTIVSPVATLNNDTAGTLTTSNRTAIIAGGTVAGVAVIIACLLAVFLCRRHQRRKAAQSHRYLPTPRSVMLAGEDDFDLAGPGQPQSGFGIFGPRRNNGMEAYRDFGSDSGRDANSPVMREMPNEPPPRLLRPVASKTGSYFQEAVWPPPEDGSRLVDPLMAASNVELHSIVDEVMGPSGQPGPSHPSTEASSSSSPAPPSRLRGGATESSSLFSESGGTPSDVRPRSPLRHGESPTMTSIESGSGDSPPRHHHPRDWSTDSSTGLLANMEGSGGSSGSRSGTNRRLSGGAWLPPGAAPPSAYTYAYGRSTSPPSPLRVVTELQQARGGPSSGLSALARGKASEAAQERRRSSLAIANPSPDEENMSSSTHAQSFSVSPTSTQGLRRLAGVVTGPGTLETTGEEGTVPYPDESPIDRRSIPSMLTRAWLVDIDTEEDLNSPDQGQRPREEIPPRYDMIRRDSEDDVQTRTRTL